MQNRHSYLKGHFVSFENNVGNIVNVLPRTNDQVKDNLQVVFSGPLSTTYRNLPKINCLSKSRLTTVVKWLIENKTGYKNVELRNVLASDDEVETFLEPVQDPTEQTLRDNLPNHESVKFTITDEELEIFHQDGSASKYSTRSGLFESSLNQDTREVIQIKASINTWLSHLKSGRGLNALSHGGAMKDTLADNLLWIEEMYPCLFPYGVTGPSAARPIPLSLEEWTRHVLQMKDTRFRIHHDFMFAMYNIIQRRRVNKATRYVVYI
jgi:hypothetical protein